MAGGRGGGGCSRLGDDAGTLRTCVLRLASALLVRHPPLARCLYEMCASLTRIASGMCAIVMLCRLCMDRCQCSDRCSIDMRQKHGCLVLFCFCSYHLVILVLLYPPTVRSALAGAARFSSGPVSCHRRRSAVGTCPHRPAISLGRLQVTVCRPAAAAVWDFHPCNVSQRPILDSVPSYYLSPPI